MPYRRRSTRPRRRPARRFGGYRKRYGAKKLHAPKKFCATIKYLDVISLPAGTSVGGWSRNNLAVSFNQLPIQPQLGALYRQYMITGVKWMYRPTNIAPNLDGQEGATQIMFVEDKANTVAITVSQAQSQDNTRFLTTAKPFSHYIRLPRPTLYQLDGAGTQQLVTQGARQGNWIDVANDTLKHLNAQMLIQDKPDANQVLQGELWCKLYVVMKEQTL